MRGFDEKWLAEYRNRDLRIKPPLPDRITFHIPLLLALPNQTMGQHWSKNNRQKKRLRDALLPVLMPYFEHEPMLRASLTVTRHSIGTAQPDWDNLFASIKPLADLLLVKSKTHPHSFGLIAGDGPHQLFPSVNAVRVLHRAQERTEVVIERIK